MIWLNAVANQPNNIEEFVDSPNYVAYMPLLLPLVIESEVVFPMLAHKLLLLAALICVPPRPLDPVYALVLSELEKHSQQKGEWEKE